MESEILQYEEQLCQIENELLLCTDEKKRGSLFQLANDVKELIKLTKESLEPVGSNTDIKLDEEYELFKAELALDQETSETVDKSNLESDLKALQDDLLSLPGMKCQAPFTYAWSDEPMYHNALVYKVEHANDVRNYNDIRVRVMFANPTHKEMKPCPYYLGGECKFTEENCRFSHGEIVEFCSIKDYKEPDFTNLSKGSHVLVKLEDDMWHRATVVTISDDNCVVKVEASSREHESHLQNILPLDSMPINVNYESTEDYSDEAGATNDVHYQRDYRIRKIFSAGSTSLLGEWEQHTKGFGSRIMAQMGYIHGSGLGANAEGRIEPVPAVVYPTGKSLDHCMMLKEKAGGDQDLFKAERKMKKIQRKHQEALNRSYEREKQRRDVFTVLNETLNNSASCSTPQPQKELHIQSQKGLNVSSLKISDEVRKIEKEIQGLNKSLSRHTSDSPSYKTIKDKIKDYENRLSHLRESERKIHSELQERKERKKLTVF